MSGIADILDRCENGRTLYGFTDDELAEALAAAGRDVQIYVIRGELARRRKWRLKHNRGARTDGMTKGASKGRCPTNKDLK